MDDNTNIQRRDEFSAGFASRRERFLSLGHRKRSLEELDSRSLIKAGFHMDKEARNGLREVE